MAKATTTAPGIKFQQVLKDYRGEEMHEGRDLSPAQIAELLRQEELPAIRAFLQKVVEDNKKKVTLGSACIKALDLPIESDKGGTLTAILKRGKLIEDIAEAEKDMKPLVLDTGEVEMLKKRVGEVVAQASVVRKICFLLDPNTKG